MSMQAVHKQLSKEYPVDYALIEYPGSPTAQQIEYDPVYKMNTGWRGITLYFNSKSNIVKIDRLWGLIRTETTWKN